MKLAELAVNYPANSQSSQLNIDMRSLAAYCFFYLFCTCASLSGRAQSPPKPDSWTDPAIALREDKDFAIQGEYAGNGMGLQLIALGEGKFDGWVLEGGLPGAGWEPGKSRRQIKGGRTADSITLKDGTGSITAVIEAGRLLLSDSNGLKKELKRIERSSPSMGAKPPDGAVVLFDGSNADQWVNGRMENGYLLATSCTTKQHFTGYTLHLEFRTPYMPRARGQGRGNSGVYHSGRWETQILDSFGLEGRDNECGGIYSISKPKLNMCLPPLSWQTYDVTFIPAKFDETGNRMTWPRITVKLNGVLVHENLELTKDYTTSAPMNTPLTSPEGPVFLQNHNNPVAFRNIWILPSK